MRRVLFKLFFSLTVLELILVFGSCRKDKLTGETVTDADGNVYRTVKIGTQTWMAENLRVTTLNDNITPISNLSNPTDWQNLSIPGYCWYKNDPDNKSKYGALYNWYTVNTGKLAPIGWHVPNDADWATLRDYLIANGYNFDKTQDNKVAKSLASTSGWSLDNIAGSVGNDQKSNNKTGFTAIPVGRRFSDGNFDLFGETAAFWSVSSSIFDSTCWGFDSSGSHLYNISMNKRIGYSIRCVKDN